MENDLYLPLGFCGAVLIAFLGYRFQSLTKSGAVAAVIVGTIIFGFGGYVGAATLLFFFISGSILSRLPRKLATEKVARDWKQVLCNGGAAALAVLLVHFVPSYRQSATLFFFGSLGAATADTWATEFGTRSTMRTYHILSFRPIERGLSGGVSVAGIIASVVGAFCCSLIPFFLLPGDDFLCGLFLAPVVPIVTAAGVIGSILDSIIGASLQAKYRTLEGKIVEAPQAGAHLLSGVSWITNDVTNLFMTFWAGLIAVGLTTF